MYILSFLELQEVRHAHKSVMVCDFLATVIGLVLWASIASGDSGLRIEIDAAAGIKIGVPSDFPASSKASKWGHSWSSTDGGVTLNSLAFEAGRSLEEIYARLTSIKGRSLTGNTGTAGGRFTLEGQDSDGQGFYIELHQDGDTVRGFSLIFAEARRNKYAPLIKRVASSFQLISASTPNSAPPALAAPVDCQAETDMLAGLARGSTVSMSAPPDLAVGGAIAVNWEIPSRFPLGIPVYLVFATPDAMRLRAMSASRSSSATPAAMKGFVALPPAARAPRN